MDIDSFSEQLFHFWDERMRSWEVEAGERDIGGLETSGEGRNVVRLWGCDVLGSDETGPEVADGLGLGDAVGCQMSVIPGDCCIAIQLRIIALVIS